jgi:uncharacterized GH25 family protein
MKITLRNLALFLALFITFSGTIAHEFWLSPINYKIEKGESINVNFYVGEGFVGENWANKVKRLATFVLYSSKNKETDLTTKAKADTLSHAKVQFKKEGTHLIAMTSLPSFIELEAEKFKAYLEEDGLENILLKRKNEGMENQSAKEFYSRCVKTLIQVGTKTTDIQQKIVGLPLEIIAIENPYNLKIEDTIQFKIFFHGKPLSKGMVKIWNRPSKMSKSEAVKCVNVSPDNEGIVKVKLQNDGEWMISIVQMEEYQNKKEADYRSYWASFTFGI